jgi:predicted DNA-binding protein
VVDIWEVFSLAQKNKVGITLSDETLERLIKECEESGLSKSQYITFLINQKSLSEKEDKRVKA